MDERHRATAEMLKLTADYKSFSWAGLIGHILGWVLIFTGKYLYAAVCFILSLAANLLARRCLNKAKKIKELLEA